MTIEEFYNNHLKEVIAEDVTQPEITIDMIKVMYITFRALVDDWKYITKIQKDCYLLYYGLKMSQQKAAQYLDIQQSTVSEHVKKARESYTELTRIIYYSTLWGIDYGHKNKEKKIQS